MTNKLNSMIITAMAVALALAKASIIAEVVEQANENAIIASGIPLYDNNSDIENAHGGCLVGDEGKDYLFGEWKPDESNAFLVFSFYSSDDHVNWKSMFMGDRWPYKF